MNNLRHAILNASTVRSSGFLPLMLLLILALLGSAFLVQAAGSPPDRMSYQGFLVDGSGNPLAPTTPVNHTVVFRIYDEAEGGNIIWAEQQVVTVDKGNFSVVLGEGAAVTSEPHGPLSAVFAGGNAASRHMGTTVTVGASTFTLLPRLRLLPSPYAFLATQAIQLVDSSTGVPFLSRSGVSTVDVTGTINATGGLTGLTDAQVPSTLSGTRTFSGPVRITDNNTLELGSGVSPKEVNNGKIGYATFTPGALDIVGAGADLASRRIKFHAQGGSEFVGRVGIGTASPTVPLEVKGFVNVTKTFTHYARGNDNVLGLNGSFSIGNIGNASGNVDYSILADRRIGATEFNAFSDARTKRIIGTSDARKDLEIIGRLRVADYQMMDKIGEGSDLRKGFIAQEVRAIIPEAVGASTRFIPDIYALPEHFKHDPKTHRLTITLPSAHHAAVGDKVRVLADAGELELPVIEVVSKECFVLGACEKKPDQMFVFGRQVSDFLSVNYDRIFTTGISAIQQLHKTVLAQEARIASLEERSSKLEALETQIEILQKKLALQSEASQRWESRFSALERLLAAESHRLKTDTALASTSPR